jgi:hypothetical protein
LVGSAPDWANLSYCKIVIYNPRVLANAVARVYSLSLICAACHLCFIRFILVSKMAVFFVLVLFKNMPQHWKDIQSLNHVHSLRFLVGSGYLLHHHRQLGHWFKLLQQPIFSKYALGYILGDFFAQKNLVSLHASVRCLYFWPECNSKSSRQAGWPDEFVKKSPKKLPSLYLFKNDASPLPSKKKHQHMG